MKHRERYIFVRFFVLISGFLMTATGTIVLAINDQHFIGASTAPLGYQLISVGPLILMGILCIIPHRWSLSNKFHRVKLGLTVLCSGYLGVLCLLGIVSYVTHQKDPMMLVTISFAILFCIGAPWTVMEKKRLAVEAKKVYG